jgi:hypothetical protein
MKSEDFLGFAMGFFLGCCGLFVAAFWLRGDYVRGALIGIGARMTLAFVLGAVSAAPGEIERVDLGGSGSGVPWELVAAFAIVVVLVVGLAAGAIWAFGGRDDDDDQPPPKPPSDDGGYVTFTR